jgi:hypothetical protein
MDIHGSKVDPYPSGFGIQYPYPSIWIWDTVSISIHLDMDGYPSSMDNGHVFPIK